MTFQRPLRIPGKPGIWKLLPRLRGERVGQVGWVDRSMPPCRAKVCRARSLSEGYGAVIACPAAVPVVVIAWSLVPVSVLERLGHLQRDPATV
jgi:hypothetical protein